MTLRSRFLALSLALLVAPAAFAQQFFHATSGLNFRILTQKAVHEELKLDDSAKSKVAELVAELEKRMRIEIHGGDPGEIQDQIRKQMGEAETYGRNQLQAFLSKEQYARFDELNWQSLGFDALMLPKVREQLKFTDEQKKVLIKEHEELSALTEELYQASASDAGDGQITFHLTASQKKQLREAKQKALDNTLAKLDDSQRNAWAAMVGAKFEFEWDAAEFK